MEKYELEIISNHPDFMGKALKQYDLDGIKTCGAYGNEPFAIKFKNNTWNKVQVKISIDGTDTSAGGAATTEPTSDMWVVNYHELKLRGF